MGPRRACGRRRGAPETRSCSRRAALPGGGLRGGRRGAFGDVANITALRQQLSVLDGGGGHLRGDSFRHRNLWNYMPFGDLRAILNNRPTQVGARR